MGQANSQHRLSLSLTNTHMQAAGRQAVSRSNTGPYGRPLELLLSAEIVEGGMDGEIQRRLEDGGSRRRQRKVGGG